MTFLSLERCGSAGDFFYYLFATTLAVLPGRIGGYLRCAFYKGCCAAVDWDVNIGFGTFFTKRNIRIGPNVGIGAYCLIGSADIAGNCWIASRVSIPSGKHQHMAATGENEASPMLFNQVKIGSHCWIGEGAIILADIGNHCIVGAGSVVARPVADHETVAGNPARNIHDRRP